MNIAVGIAIWYLVILATASLILNCVDEHNQSDSATHIVIKRISRLVFAGAIIIVFGRIYGWW